MEKRLREHHRQIETMHKFSQKQTKFGATSASKCNSLPETGNIENATGQKSSHEHTHTSHESQIAESGPSAKQEQDDDNDVVMGQFRNGSDISFKQVPIDQLLCTRLKSIHMGLAAQNGSAANQLNSKTIEPPLVIDSVPSHSTVISNAGQCTTTSKKSKDFTAESGGPCDNPSTREINEGEQNQRRQYRKQGEAVSDQIDWENATSHEATWASTSTTTSSAQKTGLALKTQSLDSRPIYPNVPYSPYASPYSSPRSNRRRPPLRESRRISIEQSGSFLQLNQYKLMDQIGQGSYGLVKLAYSEEDSTHYAMKILSKRRLLRQAGLMKRGPKKGTSPLDRVYREIAVLKKLDHPNVVKLIEVLDDPIEDSLYMVFELVKQGEVLSIPTKTPLSEERAWSVFRDTLLGLEYLHYQRIIHADIKPGNLLLTECGRVKIADLGVCNEFIGQDSTMTNGSTAGTPAFRAPETLNVGQNIYCGKAADIWALGATLYALIYGNVPFEATSVPVLYETIKNSPLRFTDNIKVCPELMDCIQRMLVKDPGSRITLPELKVHPWVTASDLHPLPSEEENCRLVQVDDDDISSVVRSIPKLDTLILIKTMLKKHSFGNPFSRGISGRAPQRGGSRLERFVRAGRSNSAPGAYPIADRQLSCDSILPALSEHTASNCTNDE